MKIELTSLHELSDADLLSRVRCAVGSERHVTADLVALLTELDTRRLYLAEGCSSLFAYCTYVLHLTEHAAYERIAAARATRKFPVLLERLRDGTLSLTSITLLAPHVTDDNYARLIEEAGHKTKRQVEEIVARLNPKPDVPATVRKLPSPKSTPRQVSGPEPATRPPLMDAVANIDLSRDMRPSFPAAIPARAEVKPLAPERFKLQLTITLETRDKLRRVQDLLRHSIPDGDLAAIIDRALTLLLQDAERTKIASVRHPRGERAAMDTRHIPASVKRAVWQRDGGRCAFSGGEGRCRETAFLEFHHVVPFAVGGGTTIDNVQLRCRAHNQHEARTYFASGLPLLRESRQMFG